MSVTLHITLPDANNIDKVRMLVEELGGDIGIKKVALPEISQEEAKRRHSELMKILSRGEGIKAFSEIEDPVEWQREQRKDRYIGRDEE